MSPARDMVVMPGLDKVSCFLVSTYMIRATSVIVLRVCLHGILLREAHSSFRIRQFSLAGGISSLYSATSALVMPTGRLDVAVGGFPHDMSHIGAMMCIPPQRRAVSYDAIPRVQRSPISSSRCYLFVHLSTNI